ncbi:endonuclease/exonuclease/phosphatase family protein [Streptomyces albidus (ex Kaewkla and Franco 2022)]|uniref:endonuclease/exonuclease/phosphatase family protein n=1 Tax=Streptomyces albidus (ex Kaewkla and Franco 2022) TaxID=722709 RepID=UPI0015EF0499|nr:endonuclease/exonuclease/phosphatase family protein [Streptomyces albidus (ex Kaewkla and Franco 2022)]
MSSRLARTSAITVVALCSTLLVLPSFSASGSTVKAPRLHEIQGSERISPLAGKQVSDVPGVVTAVRGFGKARGFWLQDPKPDSDPATSEGVFVYTGEKTPDVKVEDSVRVSGEVSEFYPGGKDVGGQSVTQLTGAKWTVKSRGERLPKAAALNADRVPDKYAPKGGENGDIEGLKLRPEENALDLYESLEGMRTQLKNAPVTGPTTEFGELWVTADPEENPTPRGGTLYGDYDEQNGARVKVSSLLDLKEHPFPDANVGDALSGTTAGPLDYDNFGGYTVRATAMGELKDNKLKREKTRKQRKDQLAVATYNVENLSPASDAAKFDRLAEGLVENLASPDVVALEEVQDNSGPDDDGTVAADKTLDQLTAAIKKAGGPAYEWRQISPEDKADGGQPGGNIRVAFLYNPKRVSFTDRKGGDATSPVKVEDDGGAPKLSANPGRVTPQDAAWKETRKPLAGEFTFRGRQVFVVANHFSSKGGDAPMEGRIQPPERASEKQRVEQAKLVNAFAKEVQSVDSKAAVIAAGDFNDFPFSPSLDAVRAGKALTSPMEKLPAGEHYGYVFSGNSQVLDHVLTSKGTGAVEYDIVHINAEFHDQASDHDPTVIRLNR